MGVASGIELGCSYELGSGRIRIRVLTRPRWGLGMVMTLARTEVESHKIIIMYWERRV